MLYYWMRCLEGACTHELWGIGWDDLRRQFDDHLATRHREVANAQHLTQYAVEGGCDHCRVAFVSFDQQLAQRIYTHFHRDGVCSFGEVPGDVRERLERRLDKAASGGGVGLQDRPPDPAAVFTGECPHCGEQVSGVDPAQVARMLQEHIDACPHNPFPARATLARQADKLTGVRRMDEGLARRPEAVEVAEAGALVALAERIALGREPASMTAVGPDPESLLRGLLYVLRRCAPPEDETRFLRRALAARLRDAQEAGAAVAPWIAREAEFFSEK